MRRSGLIVVIEITISAKGIKQPLNYSKRTYQSSNRIARGTVWKESNCIDSAVRHNVPMATRTPRITDSLPHNEAQTLAKALADADDVTVFVDGTAVRLPQAARDAVVDVLHRFAAGDAVMISSVTETLTTSQAAETAGISHTYLRNLTDAGVIPVEYRGTHRRIRVRDIEAWLATQTKPAGQGKASE